MGSFAIVTDATCALPSSVIAGERISILPIHVRFGEREYTDGVDLSRERFYEMLRATSELPTTAAPSPGECREVYESALGTDGDGALVLTISRALSATFDVATLAARSLAADVRVVDSRSVAGGTGLVVSACARARERGCSLEEAATLAERLAGAVHFYAYIHTFEYLRRSGRATALQAWFGSLLGIKPLIEVREGLIEPLTRARTSSRGIAMLRDRTAAAVGPGAPARVAVLHADSPARATELAEWAERAFRCQELFVAEVGPALAARAGPGLLALSFLAGEAASN